jgi:hypothetical protein
MNTQKPDLKSADDKGAPVESTPVTSAPAPRSDQQNWAANVQRLSVEKREGVRGTNVAGRRLTGPIQGFGKMWQKTYVTSLGRDVTPERAISEWRAHFGDFWPKGNRFAGGLAGLNPGDVALIDMSLAPGAPRLSTGVMVLYADEQSFTFMTPQGHMFAGWITFSAERTPTGTTNLQAQVLLRANDPIYELALIFGGHRKENKFWEQTLTSVSRHLGVADPVVDANVVCVDNSRQWRHWTNVWHNAAIRSLFQSGVRIVTARFRRRRAKPHG